MCRVLLALALCAPVINAEVKCVDPPMNQPGYCCDGIMPVMTYKDSCECNADWDGEECTCNGIVLRNACVHCMVHLPASNQFGAQFHDGELIGNCMDCVKRCQDDLKEPGSLCGEFAEPWFSSHYTAAPPDQVICENANLKNELFGDKLPLMVKQGIFRRPTPDPWTGDKDTRFDWDVPGIGHGQHSTVARDVEKRIKEVAAR